MQPDRRTADAILAEARWQPLRHLAAQLTVEQLRDVDRLLKRCEAKGIVHIDDVTEDLIDTVDAGNTSQRYQARLSKALSLLLPGTILACRAGRVAMRRQQKWTNAKNRPKKGRARVATTTVPEANLPLAWQRALADMRLGLGSKNCRAPALKTTALSAMKLRQLAKSALDRGLPVELSLAALAAVHADMNARGVSSATKCTTTAALGRVAKYTGAPEAIQTELRRLTAYHDGLAKLAPKRKEKKLAEVDVSPARVLATAKEILEEAVATRNPRSALSRRNEAFSLAFFMLLPQRLNDTRLVFGEHLTWDGHRWHFRVVTSKTRHLIEGRVDEYLTPYINALILDGLDPAYLEMARADCLSQKRPALITRSGKQVGYNYVSAQWLKYFGISEHIVRTEIHEIFASALGAEGTELALAACGQRSARTAQHYHTQRVYKARLTKMQVSMLELAEDLPEGAFNL